jgi:hypothetical protein
MSSDEWETRAHNTQEEVDKLRAIRSGFLDVTIEIEMDLRTMLVGYFVADLNRRPLFEDVYESQQGTLGRLVERLNKVLTVERERLTAAGADIDAVKAALSDLVKNRNTFAHQPMDQYFEVDEKTGRVLSAEMRIGKRFSFDTYFTVDTAYEAYERARTCEQLIMELRSAFGQLSQE